MAVTRSSTPGSPSCGPSDRTRDAAGHAFDIGHDPAGDKRQLNAVRVSGDRRIELEAIEAPTLVVHGEREPIFSLKADEATAAAIPGARLVVLPGVGHYVELDAFSPATAWLSSRPDRG